MVKKQIIDYMTSSIVPLHFQGGQRPQRTLRRNRDEDDSDNLKEESLRRRVAAKMADGDVQSAVRVLSSTDSYVARDCPEAINALRQKHPPAPLDLNLPPPPNEEHPADVLAEEHVMSALTAFASGSSGGLDGLRPIHLKEMTGKDALEAGSRLKGSLTLLGNLALAGGIPPCAKNAFFGASLCALRKKDGGIRPIAVGCSYRRLVAKASIKKYSSVLGSKLRPVQLGYGTSGGCEASVHAVRQYAEANSDTDKVITKLDMCNAFNCLRRDVVLDEVKKHLPGLSHFVWQAYSEESPLYYHTTQLTSATGIQQGDPLGPALFALGVHTAASGVSSELNVWYLDDATIGGTVGSVTKDLQVLIPRLASIGLTVNSSKCELLSLNWQQRKVQQEQGLFRELEDVLPACTVPEESEVMLLGAPLTDAAILPALEQKKDELTRMTKRLSNIDSHTALHILSKSQGLPRFQYLLRTSKAYKETTILEEMDDVIQRAATTILNVNLSGAAWRQACLPVSCGGLGLRKLSDMALPCFLSSLHFCLELIGAILPSGSRANTHAVIAEAAQCWSLATGIETLPDRTTASKQRSWDEPANEKRLKLLIEEGSQVDKCRLRAAGRPESGAWLHAVPVPSLGMHLDASSLRTAVALRVGASVCAPHSCCCGAEVDILGHHLLSCRRSAGRLPRHTLLNDVIKRSLQAAGVPSVLEPAGVCCADGK